MVRKTLIGVSLTGLLAAFMPWRAYSLGLGEIKLSSALNQPLQAEIRLHAVRGIPLENIQVSLASREEFARAGVEPTLGLSSLRFRPERRENGETVVEITSQDSIREPFLEFLVTVVWPQGRLSRAYTLLLDPPSVPLDPGTLPEDKKVASKERLSLQAHENGAATRRPRESVPTTYGPITSEDTLWPVAQRLRPKPSILPQQMMVALLRANPDAFLHNNLNGLIVGRVLKVPSEAEILKIIPEEAVQEVRRHNEAWSKWLKEKRTGRKGYRAEKEGEQKEAVASHRNGEGEKEAGVTVRSQEPNSSIEAETADNQGVAEERLLALIHKDLEIRTQENQRLQSRLQALEQEMNALQERVSFKNSVDLARLPAQGTAAGEEENISDKLEPGYLQGKEAVDANSEKLESLPLAKSSSPGKPGGKEEAKVGLGSLNALREAKNLLLLGGGGLLFLALIVLRIRNRNAHKDPGFPRIVGPAPQAIIEVPSEILNGIPIALQPETASAEGEKPADELASTQRKEGGERADYPIAGDLLVKPEVGPMDDEFELLSLSKGETASEEPVSEAEETVELEFDLGEITSLAQDLHKNEDLIELEEISGEEKILEFEPEEFLLDGHASQMPQAEEKGVDLEFDLGEIASFSSETLAEEKRDVFSGSMEEESSAGTERSIVEEVMGSAIDRSIADEHRPPVQSSGQELMEDLDEMEIKLDLAQAYVEMGSPQEARSILEEVIAAGDRRQRDRGQILLTQLTKVS